MLPKDYIAYKLTGVHCTDVSDASGMLLLDVKNRKWSKEMCEICGISEEMLPKLYESYECVGCVTEEVAKEDGVSLQQLRWQQVPVIMRQQLSEPELLETECVTFLAEPVDAIFISSDKFGVDKQQRPSCLCTCRRSLPSDGMVC